MPRLSVVVPVFQNREHLTELYRRLDGATCALAGVETEFVFVDDGSSDSSFELIRQLAGGDVSVKGVRLSRNFGSNAAILAGFTHATGDAVVSIAADLQDPPEMIPGMIAAWQEGAEVVLAARSERDDPLPTRLFAAIFNRLFRLLAFKDFPKAGFDFVLLDRRVVDVLCAMPEKNSYLFGQVMWVGFRRHVIPYRRSARQGGRSAWTFSRKVKYFIDAFTAFSYVPIRAASLLGFMMAAMGFLYAALVLASQFLGLLPAQPWDSALVVLVAITAGVQLVVTGLLGEYLWRVLEEVRPRPAFLVAERVNADPPLGAP